MSLQACVLVLVGGFLGGIFRFTLSGLVGRRIGETFPWGTLAVNVSGALAIGIMAGLARRSGGVLSSELLRDFAVVGILGGYTTVSSFCLQTLNLALDGERLRAAANIVMSAGLSFAAVGLGFWSVMRWPL
jgi:fluoride exporter